MKENPKKIDFDMEIKSMKKFLICLVCVGMVFCSCASYKTPVVDMPQESISPSTDKPVDSYKTAIKEEAADSEVKIEKVQTKAVEISDKWWEIFNDETLNALEKEALENNSDLQMAMARIEQAKANLTLSRGNQWPSINLVGQYQNSKTFDTLKKYGILSDRYMVGLSASYEFDLWGRYYKDGKSAKTQYLATKAGKDAVVLSLTSEVAKTYFKLLALQAQAEIAQETLKSREESFNVYQSRFKNGVVNELDFRRVEAEMESVRVQVYSLEYVLETVKTSLSVLLGKTPKDIFSAEYKDKKDLKSIVFIPEIPEGITSDVISKRPDIYQAQKQLEALNYKVKSTKTILYPSITLTGMAGYASYELEDLLKSENDTWSYSADLAFPLFTGGKVKGNYKAAKAEYDQELAAYKQTVQTAFKEILDAITANRFNKQILETSLKEEEALEISYKISIKREQAGIASLLDVLDVERSLLQTQISVVDSQLDQINSIIDFCKALGGGWVKKE